MGWVSVNECVFAFSPDGTRLTAKVKSCPIKFGRSMRDRLLGNATWTTYTWNALTGECVEALRGCGDTSAIAAGATTFSWRAMSQNGETVIEPAAGGPPVAWYPAALEHITTHPDGHLWAGAVGNHLVLLRLEAG